MIYDIGNENELLEEDISNLLKALKKSRNRERSARLKAYEDKAREGSADIKLKLRKQLEIFENCPYCNVKIDYEYCHADHIYPIAKGGISVQENMVLVCPNCNNKKSKLTLRQFAKKENLNMQEIESRLEILGKDF